MLFWPPRMRRVSSATRLHGHDARKVFCVALALGREHACLGKKKRVMCGECMRAIPNENPFSSGCKGAASHVMLFNMVVGHTQDPMCRHDCHFKNFFLHGRQNAWWCLSLGRSQHGVDVATAAAIHLLCSPPWTSPQRLDDSLTK